MSSLARLFFDRPSNPATTSVRGVHVVILLFVTSIICWAMLSATAPRWDSVWRYREVFWKGWLLTIGLSVVSLFLSVALGLILALARRSAFLPLRSLALIIIEIVRGSPLLALLLFFFYVVAAQFGMNDRLMVGVFVLSIFSGAYLAELFRSGIESIGASQLESAKAIGLTPFQTYRFVIFPQALRQTLPPLAGQLASLIKDSSLLSVLGVSEFTFAAQQVNSATYSTLESYMPLLFGYLALTLPISALSRALEARYRYET